MIPDVVLFLYRAVTPTLLVIVTLCGAYARAGRCPGGTTCVCGRMDMGAGPSREVTGWATTTNPER